MTQTNLKINVPETIQAKSDELSNEPTKLTGEGVKALCDKIKGAVDEAAAKELLYFRLAERATKSQLSQIEKAYEILLKRLDKEAKNNKIMESWKTYREHIIAFQIKFGSKEDWYADAVRSDLERITQASVLKQKTLVAILAAE